MIFSKKSWLLVAGGLLLLLLFVFLKLLTDRANLLIEIAPDSANITIDNKKVRAGKLHIDPGEHVIQARLDGFTDFSQRISVPQTGVKKVPILLNPNSSAGYAYLAKHPEEELHREAMGGQKFSATSATANQKNGLIKLLPFIDQLYRIDYGSSVAHPSDVSATAIYITYYAEEGKQQALDWITLKGFDPNTLEIVYVDGNSSGD